MQPKRSGLKRMLSWMGAGAAGVGLLYATNKAIQPKPHTQITNQTRIEKLNNTNKARPRIIQTNTISMSIAAREAKIAGLVKAGLGTKANKMSTNTMIGLHDACKKAFDAQGKTFGTNEIKGSMIALKNYLGKSQTLQEFWLKNSGNKWSKAIDTILDKKLIPADSREPSEAQQQERIRKVIIETSKLNQLAKQQILTAIKQ